MNSYARFFALFVMATIPNVALAHGLGVTVTIVNQTVAVEARFDSDDPADDCEVTVTANDGREIVKGMTNKNGLFTFPLPEPGEYRIVADAGAGHRAKKTLTVTASEPLSQDLSVKRSVSWPWTLFGILLIATGTTVWMKFAQSRRRAIPA